MLEGIGIPFSFQMHKSTAYFCILQTDFTMQIRHLSLYGLIEETVELRTHKHNQTDGSRNIQILISIHRLFVLFGYTFLYTTHYKWVPTDNHEPRDVEYGVELASVCGTTFESRLNLIQYLWIDVGTVHSNQD